MKLWYIANARMPSDRAHAIQLAKMCEAFIKESMLHVLLVPRREKNVSSPRTYYGLRYDLPLFRIPVLNLYGLGRPGFLLSSFVFALFTAWWLLKERLMGKNGIIYTIDMDQFSFLLVPMLGLPYMVELHDAKPRSMRYRFLLKNACGIITVNRDARTALVDTFGLDEKRIITCPNGIDLALFEGRPDMEDARRMHKLPLDQNIIVYMGRCYAWKGLDIVIDAARFFPERTMLVMVGMDEKELLRLTGASTLPSYIRCVGVVPWRAIKSWYAAADAALVIGTQKNVYSYLHTSPMKLFEGMAAEVPLIAASTPAIREIVSDKEVFFYEPDNPKSLGDAMRKVLEEKEARMRKVRRARKLVEVFTWDARAQRIKKFITHICGSV
ncbi:MAG: group 1 glycosyl transferase [Parcubacteria group bacterium Gr01-1014_66]|nr:MAG: group 1 glycosyl transferase [Parcubacteria group bacterium Gr01-1014_66]